MAIRFNLNGLPRVEAAASATMTVLDWLRTRAHLTGTKEGCAEGDCGACTIMVGRTHNGAVRWQAVNACLMVVGQLDGAAVLTVEGVTPADGLNPVQQALIDADATQCGFCTPGFVMAMTALQQGDGSSGERGDDAIHEALAGNLCRCTGYRAIVDACRSLEPAAPIAPGPLPQRSSEHRAFDHVFLAPATLDELLALRARHPDAVLLAGGTDLGLRLSKERAHWPLVISTANVAALARITVTESAISVGAGATYTDLLPHLDRHIPAFAALVRRIGSRQIRNLGTLAGNLATTSPIGDSLPCLMALDATVEVRSQTAETTVAIADFITGYRKNALATGEIIVCVNIPIPRPEARFCAYKLSKRFDQDISTVVAAFFQDGREVRAAFGGMAAKVMRAPALEKALAKGKADALSLADIAALLAQDFAPMSDHRGSAAYRLRAAAGLVRRFILETSGSAAPLHLEAL